MCGIAGISAASAFDPALLERAVGALAHRGPDGHGRFISADGRCGLGHTRLSIIDLSEGGHQPMTASSGRFTISYNGEIYNYRALRDELAAAGFAFTSASDTEVLLHGFAHWGTGLLVRLNGIFAFAIHDGESGDLFIARDHLGVKPLYCSSTGGRFAFASEIKALLRLAPQEARFDSVAAARYVSFLWCPGDRTPFAGVRKLEPGSAMVVRRGEVLRQWQWWSPPAYAPGQFASAQACASQLAQHLDAAVERQMVSDAPLGAFLSGGLDSSAVVASAMRVNPQLQCFTIRVTGAQDEGVVDDLPYARMVARELGAVLHEVEIAESAMADDVQRMVWMLDEPLADPASLNVLYISQLARQHGIKVLLSGTGGDDVFSGYRRHAALAWADRLSAVPRGVFGLGERLAAQGGSRGAVRKARKLLGLLAARPQDRLVDAFRWLDQGWLSRLLLPELRREVAGDPVDQPMRDLLAGLGTMPELEQCLAMEKRFFLADHNLIYTDKMAMAAGVEVRVPLLDIELLDFAATIPAEWKMHGQVPKWIFKQSQRGRVPAAAIDRPKAGFGAPLRHWLDGGLKVLADDLLSDASLRRRGMFDPAAVAALRAANRAGRIDASYPLFALMCIELWYRSFSEVPE